MTVLKVEDAQGNVCEIEIVKGSHFFRRKGNEEEFLDWEEVNSQSKETLLNLIQTLQPLTEEALSL